MAFLMSRMARGVIGCTIGAVRMIGSTLASATRTASGFASVELGGSGGGEGERSPREAAAAAPASMDRPSGFISWLGDKGSSSSSATLNARPGGELKMTTDTDPTKLTEKDINLYHQISDELRERHFCEGLPGGLGREFETTGAGNVMVRASVLELVRRMEASLHQQQQQQRKGVGRAGSSSVSAQHQRAASWSEDEEPQRSFLIDGPVGSGKSVALAFAVHWARSAGWLTMYVPSAKYWTHGGLFYKHSGTGMWDTPMQAKVVLQGFLSSHADILERLPARVRRPVELGESAGMGPPRSPTLVLPEGASLKDLVGQGISQSHAAVGVVVRLREELAQVTEVPVMIAIDEYNAMLSNSGYNELKGTRGGQRRIHAKELRMVDAFRRLDRSPLANGVIVAALSHSISVGRNLPLHLLYIPRDIQFRLPRYNEKESASALHYYYTCGIGGHLPTPDSVKWMHYLTNGNGEEMRTLASLS